jgi:cell division protein FtsW (lipid II flippase)
MTPPPATTKADFRALVAFRAAAFVALVVGAAASLVFEVRGGRRNPSQLLIAGIALWVLSPYFLLLIANASSRRWSTRGRLMLHCLTVILALVPPIFYADQSLRPANTSAAFLFVAIPPALWLVIAIVIAIAEYAMRATPAVAAPDAPVPTDARSRSTASANDRTA